VVSGVSRRRARASKPEDTTPYNSRTIFVSLCRPILCHCVKQYLSDRLPYAQNAQNRLLSAHIEPPPPLPNGSELPSRQKYLQPAITAPDMRKRLKDRIQPVPDSMVRSLSRGASAAERIAEGAATEVILYKGLQSSQITRRIKTTSKKGVLMCISNIASHGYRPIIRFKETEMTFSVKQLFHSSPVDIRSEHLSKLRTAFPMYLHLDGYQK
jgi:hypothetical protein